MRLSPDQVGVVRDIERICAHETDPRVLRQRVATRLSRVLHWDAACFSTIDPWTMLITDDVFEGIPPDVYALTAVNEYLVDDVNKFVKLARSGTRVGIVRRAPTERRRAGQQLQTIHPMLDIRHELLAACLVDGQCWGRIAVFRTGEPADFSPAEAALVQAISAPLAAGLRRTAYRPQADAGVLADAGPGVLVLGRDNETEVANDAAQQYLDELAYASARGGDLPIAVHQVAARARLSPPDRTESLRHASARVRTPSGRWLALHGSPVGDDLNPGRGVAVVLESAPAFDVAELLMLVHGLTRRERQVVQKVIAGAPSTVISAQLYISVHTVQDHLKSIFAKFGVRSRGELVAAILEQDVGNHADTAPQHP
jgi:DNA-binding CsgD family transcriptional regulator